MTTCLTCGTENNDNAKFCISCGSPLAPPPESWRDDSSRETLTSDSDPFALGSETPIRVTRKPSSTETDFPASPTYAAPESATFNQTSRSFNQAAPLEPVQPVGFQNTNEFAASSTDNLAQLGFIIGIVSLCVMVLGLVPCLGWLNWFTIGGSLAALILSYLAFSGTKLPAISSKARTGMILGAIALIVGGLRLKLGGGCI